MMTEHRICQNAERSGRGPI